MIQFKLYNTTKGRYANSREIDRLVASGGLFFNWESIPETNDDKGVVSVELDSEFAVDFRIDKIK